MKLVLLALVFLALPFGASAGESYCGSCIWPTDAAERFDVEGESEDVKTCQKQVRALGNACRQVVNDQAACNKHAVQGHAKAWHAGCESDKSCKQQAKNFKQSLLAEISDARSAGRSICDSKREAALAACSGS
jgi:hypothetical protein